MSERARPSGREWAIRALFAVLLAALVVVVAATLLQRADPATTTEGRGPGSNAPADGVHPAWTSITSP